MQPVQRVTGLDGLAQLDAQVHTGPRHLWRAAQAGDAGQAQVVDAHHHAVGRCQHIEHLVTQGRRRGAAALGVDDGVHAGQGATGIQDVAGDAVTLAAAHIRVELDHAPGQAQRLLPQVLRRVGVVLQHLHDIARLQHRADAAADGLAPVGDHRIQLQAQARSHDFEQALQALRRRHAAHLGGGAHGDVQHQVGGAGGDLLGQDGGHHLPGRVDGQRALHRDQDVVGGRQVGGAAPGQAAMGGAHDLLQPRQRQFHLGQHLHGVGRARGRGDGARRGLGAAHAVRGHDGHHQHRGAVARDAADAVLVHHRPAANLRAPVQAAADGDHGLGQVQHLVAVEFELVGGHDKGRQLDLGVARRRDVLHHGAQVLAAQAFARDLAVQRGDGGRGLRRIDARGMAGRHGQAGEGVLAQAQFHRAHDGRIVHHVQHGEQGLAVGLHLHLRQGLEARGAHHRTVAVQKHHALAPGVDAHAADGEGVAVHDLGCWGG